MLQLLARSKLDGQNSDRACLTWTAVGAAVEYGDGGVDDDDVNAGAGFFVVVVVVVGCSVVGFTEHA